MVVVAPENPGQLQAGPVVHLDTVARWRWRLNGWHLYRLVEQPHHHLLLVADHAVDLEDPVWLAAHYSCPV